MSSADKSESVRVVVRCRPVNSSESQRGCKVVVKMDTKTGKVDVFPPKADSSDPPKSFTFDSVYDDKSTQEMVYNQTARPIVESVLDGYNGTIFAYGQTGTGKTHTMEGKVGDAELEGITPRAFKHIFEAISLNATDGKSFLVRASYLEIYNEEIRDLLAKDPKNKLELKENPDSGVYVKDLSSFVVNGVAEIDKVMAVGKKNRTIGSTKMNQESSRSHSIFTITIETSESSSVDGENHIRVGKLNLVDLAGSERQTKTEATGERLKEGIKINLSLSALGNVISALVDGKSQHVPYRDSKLTRLLQDSLGGNSRTVMVANCGPADYNYDETLSTLRYANRAKNIKNKPKINEDPKDAMLREFQEEIARLKAELERKGTGETQIVYQQVPGAPAAAAAGGTGFAGISEEMMKELEMKSKEEREALLKEKNMAEEERIRLAQELENRKDVLEQERKQREALSRKLQAMQEKLIVGGENILDKAAKQEAELRRQATELEERRIAELRLQQELEDRAEQQMHAEEKYFSVQEEVEIKTKKLKKLWAKLQSAQQEIEDLQSEFQQEREDMLNTIRDLTHEIKLKQLVIDLFIPPEELEKIEKRAMFDEDRDEWVIQHAQLTGNVMRVNRPTAGGYRRPITQYARNATSMGDPNPRFKSENVLHMDLDLPDRTTQDYENPNLGPRVQAALSAALAEEDDMTFQASENIPNVYFAYDAHPEDDAEARRAKKTTSRPQSARRPKTASRKKKEDEEPSGPQYPASRGLVNK